MSSLATGAIHQLRIYNDIPTYIARHLLICNGASKNLVCKLVWLLGRPLAVENYKRQVILGGRADQ